MFHPFPIARSRAHILSSLVVLSIPFAAFWFFSAFTGISAVRMMAELGVSLMRVVVALVISIVLAWTLAVLFYSGTRGAVALPIFDLLQSIPTSALLPLAVLYLGPSTLTVIAFLIVTIVWPLLFSVISALKLIRKDWEEAVSMAHLNTFDYVRYFLLPASIPGLITGIIIGLGEGWEALIATELIVKTPQGLGAFFAAFSHDPQATAVGIVALMTIIFAINKLVWLPLLEWSHRMVEE